MAKKKIEPYTPTLAELKAMYYCNSKNVAYSIEPNKNKLFYIVKFIPSDYKNVIYLKENNKKVEMNEQDAIKKIMQLYVNQSKLI